MARSALWQHLADDEVVKFLFDNLRNIGLAALVAAAARWFLVNAMGVGEIVLGVLLSFVAIALFVVILRHGTSKLLLLNLSVFFKFCLGCLYGIIIGALLLYFAHAS